MTQNAPRKSGDLIDQNLRRAFLELTEEELPDRFKNLLERLKSGERPGATEQEGPTE